MNRPGDLLIRNVTIDGRPSIDALIQAGRLVALEPNIRWDGPSLEGSGGALMPGLTDHHLHLLALAAQAESLKIDQASIRNRGDFEHALKAAAQSRPAGTWLRVTGYDESVAGDLDCASLDGIVSDRPVRVQHYSGRLWVLNSCAIDQIMAGQDLPACIERDDTGRLTGRVWRGDDWLRTRLRAQPPRLAEVGAALARMGITRVTDASATTGAAEAVVLADAARSGLLPQRLTLMSGGPLLEPSDAAFAVGPLKIMLDESDLPDSATMIARIAEAHRGGRNVAVHCVTATELAFTLAALDSAGSEVGDRIEHGGIIDEMAIETIAALGLTVVTQPGFLFVRGDRYRREVDAGDLDCLYRCKSLIEAGVIVAGSSDAPYGVLDPWISMRAAVERRTRQGAILGPAERITFREALALYHGRPAPGAISCVEVGRVADLCVLENVPDAIENCEPCPVKATIIDGRIVYSR